MRPLGKLILYTLMVLFLASGAHAIDNGQWENTDPAIKQPDNPHVSCCGEADAYYTDKVYTKDGKNIAVVTDTRPDEAFKRPHVPPGTDIVIPDRKMKWDRGNPTGHNIIFLNLLIPGFTIIDRLLPNSASRWT